MYLLFWWTLLIMYYDDLFLCKFKNTSDANSQHFPPKWINNGTSTDLSVCSAFRSKFIVFLFSPLGTNVFGCFCFWVAVRCKKVCLTVFNLARAFTVYFLGPQEHAVNNPPVHRGYQLAEVFCLFCLLSRMPQFCQFEFVKCDHLQALSV